MEEPDPQSAMPKNPIKHDATQKQLRGSSLLLIGRFLSLGINFATQVLMVRYLSKADFGAWSYALSVITLFQAFACLGLDRSISRFVPIYHEKREYEKLFGTIALALSTIAITAVFSIVAVRLSPELIARMIDDKNEPVFLLLVLIFMVPVAALDNILVGLFAAFAKPSAIFFRKHLLGPSLKLAVVLLLIHLQTSVLFLAYGYLVASGLGVLIYSWVLVSLLREQGLFQRFRLGKITIPANEIFAFTLPLLTSELVVTLMHTADALLLGYYHGISDVASYRVILPASNFNHMVMTSFSLLYTPLAARLFAKKDYLGINELYWRTAIWMGVLTFPLFALTFSMAKPVTLFLYGERYAQSYVFLQLLSLGYYFNVAMGFNGLTLKVLGKVRYVVIINFTAVAVNVLLDFLLIPRFGALGAAIATSGAMISHNILKQTGLRLASGISIFDWQYLNHYLLIVFSALGLLVVQYLSDAAIYFDFALVALVSLVVLFVSRKKLKIEETFPELRKLPFVRLLLSTRQYMR